MNDTYRCTDDECGEVFAMLVERAERDNPQECPECGNKGRRTFAVPHIRTPKTSASFIDGTKRFGKFRELQKLKELKAGAKADGDRPLEKQIEKEISSRKGKA